MAQAKNGASPQPFDPEQDPFVRKWAARFNLPADDRIVVITAEVERIREGVFSRLENSESKSKESQELWGASLNQTNNTLSQALSLVQQQQANQTALTKTYSQLTDSLLKFETVLNTLSERIDELPKTSQDLVSGLKTELTSLKSENQTIARGLVDLKTTSTSLAVHNQKSSFRPWWMQWLILVLLAVNIVLSIPHEGSNSIPSLSFAPSRDLNYVADRSEWALMKLDRIENALGIQR